MNTVAELLESAADLLRRGGVCVAKLETPQGEHCSLGAIAKAMYPAESFLTYDFNSSVAYYPKEAVHAAAVEHLADSIRRSGLYSLAPYFKGSRELVHVFNDTLPALVLNVFYAAAASAQDQDFTLDEEESLKPQEEELPLSLELLAA